MQPNPHTKEQQKMFYQETTLMPGNNEGDTEFTPADANGALGQWVDAISEERSSFGDYRP